MMRVSRVRTPDLFGQVPQPVATRDASADLRFYWCVLALRADGRTVHRRGLRHVLDGKVVDAELIRNAGERLLRRWAEWWRGRATEREIIATIRSERRLREARESFARYG